MTETVRLSPLKRIEGHGRVALHLDGEGGVANAHFEAIEFRGFEKFLEGRMIWEMPLMTSRVCGVCPVSHHIAAVKAADAVLGVEPPRTARLLRELLHLAGFVHDHALHFFFLAGPDFLTEGTSRDLLGVVRAKPELAIKAIGLRKAGQRVVQIVGGQGHPVTAIPGGMSRGITPDEREEARVACLGALQSTLRAERLAKECTARLLIEHPNHDATPTAYLAQMGEGGAFDLYDGEVTLWTPQSETVSFPAEQFKERVSERTVPYSYAKRPYLSELGPDLGTYRVGPLARLNLVESMPGPHSQELLAEYREELGRPVHHALAYHWARMIELVAAVERMLEILDDPDVVSEEVRVKVERTPGEGAAIVEAPRGTLYHRYEADEVGRVTQATLIVATTHNGAAIDRAVCESVAGERYNGSLEDSVMLRLERAIRAYDPCLSCATHESGRMPFVVEVIAQDGVRLGQRAVR